MNLDRICSEKGGVRNDDVCLIQVTSELDETISEEIESVNFDNITTMKPNSVEFFYYHGPGKDKDTHQLFMLIRLPEWMGGAENNTSAY